MCGIVGLFLKDKTLEPRLGALLSDMLVTMTDRGPDSAGIAIYGPATAGRAKLTVQSAAPEAAFAGLAGASTAATKPLDGVDLWPALTSAGGRTEIVYNVEPSQAAIRQGRWKLHWLPTLPPSVELFDLDADPGESTNLAPGHPEVVAALQARAEALAREMAPPLFYGAALDAALSAPLATPGGEALRRLGAADD